MLLENPTSFPTFFACDPLNQSNKFTKQFAFQTESHFYPLKYIYISNTSEYFLFLFF